MQSGKPCFLYVHVATWRQQQQWSVIGRVWAINCHTARTRSLFCPTLDVCFPPVLTTPLSRQSSAHLFLLVHPLWPQKSALHLKAFKRLSLQAAHAITFKVRQQLFHRDRQRRHHPQMRRVLRRNCLFVFGLCLHGTVLCVTQGNTRWGVQCWDAFVRNKGEAHATRMTSKDFVEIFRYAHCSAFAFSTCCR